MATSAKTERRWFVPNKRAASYAEERKAKVHQRGAKEGQELTEYEKGLRSGYWFFCGFAPTQKFNCFFRSS